MESKLKIARLKEKVIEKGSGKIIFVVPVSNAISIVMCLVCVMICCRIFIRSSCFVMTRVTMVYVLALFFFTVISTVV